MRYKMTKTVEWNVEEAIEQSMNEAWLQHEVEANERRLKWCRERILNRGKERTGEQANKVSRDVLAKQAEILERGGNPADPAEYDDDDDYDDDDYDADEWYLDDECYPDDE